MLVTCICLATLALGATATNAQGKVTREQAWPQCLEQALQQGGTDPTGSNARVAAFKACMANLGFKP